jgi:4-hydroxy-2-oxoheptanedioate aldolase
MTETNHPAPARTPAAARDHLKKGGVLIGVFCKTTAPEFIEVLGHAGFDFCILDQEHGPANLETLQHLIRAAEVSGVLPIVRTRDRAAESVSQPLDLGAAGVQVPQVSSKAEGEAVLDAARFAPLGHRGVCRFVRAARFSALDRASYFSAANEALVVLQLEGTHLSEYEKVADIPGVDILFIGPYDLSQALGIPGQIEHPRVLEEMQKIIAVARRKAKTVGVFADSLTQTQRWIQAGVQYIAYSVDVGLFYAACRETVAAIRAQSGAR